MAKRGKRFISGDLTIDIKANDLRNKSASSRGRYIAKVCRRAKHRLESGECERVVVMEPQSSRFAFDSPRAFHDAAHAAISFSKLSDYAMPNPKGTGWSLRKPRPARRR